MTFINVDWVPGFEDVICVNHQAIAKYIETGEVLKVHYNSRGFAYVSVWHNGKRKNLMLHRLVARAFRITGYSEHRRVAHLNGDKTFNFVCNLLVPETEEHGWSDCESDGSM